MRGKEYFPRLISTAILAATVGACRLETNTSVGLESKGTPTPIVTPNIFQNQEPRLEFTVPASAQEPTQFPTPTPGLASTKESTPVPSPAFTKEPTKIIDQLNLLGINFRDGLATRMIVQTNDKQEITIDFHPRAYENNGQDIADFCAPGKDVCALSAQGKNILLLTHSGYRSLIGQRLESESLRQYVEGGGRKILSEEERQANLESLIGARISLQQENNNLTGEIVNAIRLSPKEAEGLTHLDVFNLVSENQPENQRYLGLVFCGWQDDNEEAVLGSAWYAWSRYILLIKPQE
jgi:hypothetical protein